MKLIYEYDNYREYLNDRFKELASTSNLTHYEFARRAGLKTSSFLTAVIRGERNLTEKTMKGFCRALEIADADAVFFENLVNFNQAKTVEEKQLHARKLLRFKKLRKVAPLIEAQYAFYSNWYYGVIFELLRNPEYAKDPEKISSKLVKFVRKSLIQQALEDLEKLGMIDFKNGVYKQRNDFVVVPEGFISEILVHHQLKMIEMATESIFTTDPKHREVSGLTFGLPEKDFEKVKDMVQKFHEEMMEVVSGLDNPDSVYQLNIQLFPLAKSKPDPV